MARLIESEAKGTVHTYNSDKGYGFLRTFDIPDHVASSIDVFFHISDLPTDSVEEGWRFQFSLMKSEEGYRAEDIVIISKKDNQQNNEGGQNLMMPEDETSTEEDPDEYLFGKMQENKSSNKEEESEESPFEDEDVRGSKNDLLK